MLFLGVVLLVIELSPYLLWLLAIRLIWKIIGPRFSARPVVCHITFLILLCPVLFITGMFSFFILPLPIAALIFLVHFLWHPFSIGEFMQSFWAQNAFFPISWFLFIWAIVTAYRLYRNKNRGLRIC